MAKYKVTNLDAPIEADYWVDIQLETQIPIKIW